MRSKFYVWAEYFEKLVQKDLKLSYGYKVNDMIEYQNLDVVIKTPYETDLTYTPHINLEELCVNDDKLKITNDYVNHSEDGFHVYVTIKCTLPPNLQVLNKLGGALANIVEGVVKNESKAGGQIIKALKDIDNSVIAFKDIKVFI